MTLSQLAGAPSSGSAVESRRLLVRIHHRNNGSCDGQIPWVNAQAIVDDSDAPRSLTEV